MGPAPAEDTVWLTVKPANLLAALRVWRAGDPGDPQLLERIDTVLRSGVPVAASDGGTR